MPKRKRAWLYKKAVKDARRALKANRRMDQEIAFYQEALESVPQSRASSLRSTVGVLRWCEALILAQQDPEKAWPRVHLVWRYEAFHWRVYIERAEQLVRMYPNPKKAPYGRLPIGDIEFQWFNDILMTMALSAVLGEDRVAQWFGDWCRQVMDNRPPYVTADAWNRGRVEPYLIRLYCRWRGTDIDLKDYGVKDYRPFSQVFDHWDNPELLEQTVLKLCRLHEWKVINRDLADNDFIFGLQTHVHSELPSEILFLQRVRRDLGLSVPNPEHPLLRSPLMAMPFPCPKSGYDPCLDEVYTSIKKDMPELRIEWEEEFQKLGPGDPKSLPLVDLDL